MKAVVYTRYGGPEVLHLAEADTPVLGNGQVLRYLGEGHAKGKVVITVE